MKKEKFNELLADDSVQKFAHQGFYHFITKSKIRYANLTFDHRGLSPSHGNTKMFKLIAVPYSNMNQGLTPEVITMPKAIMINAHDEYYASLLRIGVSEDEIDIRLSIEIPPQAGFEHLKREIGNGKFEMIEKT